MPRAKRPKRGRRDNGSGNWTRLKDSDGNETGKIRVEFRLTNGATGKTKPISRIAHSELDAGKVTADLKAELDRKYPDGVWWPEAQPTHGTVSWLLDEWQAHAFPAMEGTSRDFYRAQCRYIREGLGDVPVSELTRQQVNRFLEGLVTLKKANPHPLSAVSKGRVRTTLAMAYDYALDHDATLTTNPAREARVPRAVRKDDVDDEPRWFTEEEAARFFDAVRTLDDQTASQVEEDATVQRRLVWLGAAWAVQFYCGLRPGEVRALAWSDLDLEADAPTLTVRTGQKRTGGKTIVRGRTKTKGSKRTLAVPATLKAQLQRHRELQANQRTAVVEPDRAWNPDDLVFCRADGSPVPKETYAREFAKVCDAAKIEDASPYALRHSFVTLSIYADVPLPTIAAACGHTDLRMITQVYGHLLKGTVTGFEDALPDLLATV